MIYKQASDGACKHTPSFPRIPRPLTRACGVCSRAGEGGGQGHTMRYLFGEKDGGGRGSVSIFMALL